jgi:FkbM family methyltransferase
VLVEQIRIVMSQRLNARLVSAAKRLLYGKRGEPITYGVHRLRYLVGSRPVRLKYANSTDIVARNDARQIQFFIDHVRAGQLVLDIGGHYGEYAVLFAALVGSEGRVVTFEPDAAARPVLQANIALNHFTERVQVEAFAVSDAIDSQTLFARHGNAQSSLARAGLGGSQTDDDVEKYQVPTIRIDEYLRQSQLRAPDIIKLDVEGAEINALRGAGEILRSKVVILCELHPYAWPEFGTSFDDLLRLIADHGRSIRYLDDALRIENGASYGAVVIS